MHATTSTDFSKQNNVIKLITLLIKITKIVNKCLLEFLSLQSCEVTPLADQFQESLPQFFVQTSE